MIQRSPRYLREPLAPPTPFETYCQVRDSILEMTGARSEDVLPDDRIVRQLQRLQYFYDASPAMVDNWLAHYHGAIDPFAEEMSLAKEEQRRFKKLLPLDQGIHLPRLDAAERGTKIGDHLVAAHTIRFYEALLILEATQSLAPFRTIGHKQPVLWEFSGEWGGFAAAFKQQFPNACCVLIDYPENLIVAGTYLRNRFPGTRVHTGIEDSSDADFLLVTYNLICRAQMPYPQLAAIGNSQWLDQRFVEELVPLLKEYDLPRLLLDLGQRSDAIASEPVLTSLGSAYDFAAPKTHLSRDEAGNIVQVRPLTDAQSRSGKNYNKPPVWKNITKAVRYLIGAAKETFSQELQPYTTRTLAEQFAARRDVDSRNNVEPKIVAE